MAAVFLWFGVDKIFHPAYWLNAWLPQSVVTFVAHFGLSGIQLIYINAVFEILVGLSLITGIFTKVFSFLAIVFLIIVLATNRVTEVTVRDLAIIGGFVAVLLWPDDRRR